MVGFKEIIGCVGFDWVFDFGWFEDSLFYVFYLCGYKGGGINLLQLIENLNVFLVVFDLEFVDLFEVGIKNMFVGGVMQLNGMVFMYDYQGYQIFQIVNWILVNFNVDVEICGFEFEIIWNFVLIFLINVNFGFFDVEVVDMFGVDMFDWINGCSDFVVFKQFVGVFNCVVFVQGYVIILGVIVVGNVFGVMLGVMLGFCLGVFVGVEVVFGVLDVIYMDSNG